MSINTLASSASRHASVHFRAVARIFTPVYNRQMPGKDGQCWCCGSGEVGRILAPNVWWVLMMSKVWIIKLIKFYACDDWSEQQKAHEHRDMEDDDS